MTDFTKKEYEYHPILLAESRGHYDTKCQNNIIEFEQENTICGALAACSYNIIKYTNRQKNQDSLDDKKKLTFFKWRELLLDLIRLGYSEGHILRDAMQIEYPKLKYSLKD